MHRTGTLASVSSFPVPLPKRSRMRAIAIPAWFSPGLIHVTN
jgi:hypothetical protein